MRMTPPSLGQLLAAIAATAVASTACKKTPVSSEDRPPPGSSTSSSGASADAAPVDWTRDEMKDVKTSSPVEGIAVYATELDSQGKTTELQRMAEYGSACSQVNGDPTDCSKLSRLVREQATAKRAAFAVVRRADHFELITERDALRVLLGEIDTPKEAELLATFAGASKVWSPQCTGFTRTIVMEKGSPAGYRMKLEKRVRKENPSENCSSDCIIAESRDAVVRPNGNVELGAPKEDFWVRPMGCGRSPGWSCAESRPRTAAEYLAYAAHLEAASVAAFERIAEELVALDAPRDLVVRARRAADDERRHARAFAFLARAHGAEPLPFVAQAYALRNAFELALDNAVEGCVNETFGALVLHVQALTAEDGVMRRVFASIARDEASHADLSHDLGEWLDGRLSVLERATVVRASMRARDAIECGPALGEERELRWLGLPDRATGRALYEAFVTS